MLQGLHAFARENALGVLGESGTNGRFQWIARIGRGERSAPWLTVPLVVALASGTGALPAPDEDAGSQLPLNSALTWSTFLGGVGSDTIEALDVDTSGEITVAGWTGGYDFPVTDGAFQMTPSPDYHDAFVARFSASGQLLWCTLLGGTDGDTRALAMAVARGGEVWITGDTAATDFPTTTGAWQTIHSGNAVADAFVARLSADGSSLLASTLFGGTGDDGARALVLLPLPPGATGSTGTTGAAGTRVVVAGWSRSLDVFEISQATSVTGTSLIDSRAFVAGFDAELEAMQLECLLDGSGDEEATGLAVRADGTLVVVGQTDSPDFPTTAGAWQPAHMGDWDCFVATLDPAGGVQAATYIGGSQQEYVPAVALGPGRDLWVTGGTASADFPTTAGAADTSFGGGGIVPMDGFVLRIRAQLDQLAWSTLLGGNGLDAPTGLWVDAFGRATVVGDTGSDDFPVTAGAMDTQFNGGDANFPTDAFVARITADGSEIPYCTFMGGTLGDGARALYCYGPTSIVIAGASQSVDLPVTPGAFQLEHGGSGFAPLDGFVARLELGPKAGWIPASGGYGTATVIQGTGAEPGALGFLVVEYKGVPVGVEFVQADHDGAFSFPASPADDVDFELHWRTATGAWVLETWAPGTWAPGTWEPGTGEPGVSGLSSEP